MTKEKTQEEMTPKEIEKSVKLQVSQLYHSGLTADGLALDLKSALFLRPLLNAEQVAVHNYQMERLKAIIGEKFDEVIDTLINNFASMLLKM